MWSLTRLFSRSEADNSRRSVSISERPSFLSFWTPSSSCAAVEDSLVWPLVVVPLLVDIGYFKELQVMTVQRSKKLERVCLANKYWTRKPHLNADHSIEDIYSCFEIVQIKSLFIAKSLCFRLDHYDCKFSIFFRPFNWYRRIRLTNIQNDSEAVGDNPVASAWVCSTGSNTNRSPREFRMRHTNQLTDAHIRRPSCRFVWVCAEQRDERAILVPVSWRNSQSLRGDVADGVLVVSDKRDIHNTTCPQWA
jgi:hypothetical protein